MEITKKRKMIMDFKMMNIKILKIPERTVMKRKKKTKTNTTKTMRRRMSKKKRKKKRKKKKTIKIMNIMKVFKFIKAYKRIINKKHISIIPIGTTTKIAIQILNNTK